MTKRIARGRRDQTGAVLRERKLHLMTHRTPGDLYAAEAAAF